MARGAKERTFAVRTDHNVTEFERVEDLVVQNWFCGVRKRRFGFMAAGRQFERGSVISFSKLVRAAWADEPLMY